MTRELFRGEVVEASWGKANPQRGRNYIDQARAFGKAFPIGTTLTIEKFDEWASQLGVLFIPPADTPKNSDTWMAHLQRRHRLRYNLNKASTHPRMETPFVIEALPGSSILEVRSPQLSVSQNNILRRVNSLVVTKKKQLGYLMQSADWSVLPPHEKALAQSVYDDIDCFDQRVSLESSLLDNKLRKLEYRLQAAINRGEIQPQDRGIAGFLGRDEADNPETDVEEIDGTKTEA
jgi:hypothetical protein